MVRPKIPKHFKLPTHEWRWAQDRTFYELRWAYACGNFNSHSWIANEEVGLGLIVKAPATTSIMSFHDDFLARLEMIIEALVSWAQMGPYLRNGIMLPAMSAMLVNVLSNTTALNCTYSLRNITIMKGIHSWKAIKILLSNIYIVQYHRLEVHVLMAGYLKSATHFFIKNH
jgi:hypothetical protein